MLNKRAIEIIEHLLENNLEINLKDAAEKFEISERSIRYDIDNINYYFHKAGLSEIEKSSKGIYSIDESKESIQKVLEKIIDKFYVFTAEERKNFMKMKFLFFRENKLFDFTEDLEVSISTIKGDLKEVKIFLMENDLNLIFVSKQGIILEGTEEKIRKLQLKMLNRYFEIRENALFIKEERDDARGTAIVTQELMNLFSGFEQRIVRVFIRRIEKKLNTLISDEAFNILQLYIMLLIGRVREGFSLPNREENKNFLIETSEFKILRDEITHLESEYELKINESELIFLTELFLGSHSYNFNSSFFDNWIELEVSVNAMIRELSRELEIDLTHDKILVDGLLNHLRPAYYRIRNEIVLENGIASEVEELYRDLYEKVDITCRKNLEEYIGKKIPKEEIAYITIHFKGAIDRKLNSQRKTKNVLLVCGLGYGSSKLLAQKLSERYDVNIIDTIPYHKFIELEKYEDIDLLITTLDISFDLQYTFPIIKVNPILSKNDRELLERYGLTESRKRVSLKELLDTISQECEIKDEAALVKKLKILLKNRYNNDLIAEKKYNLSSLMRRDNIDFSRRVDNWEEAIRAAGEILLRNGSVLQEYVDKMVDNVYKNGSYMVFADKLALPHARTEGSVKKTDFSLVRLEKPVEFPGRRAVRIIVAFSSLDQKEHMEALTTLVDLIENENFAKVIENSTEDEISEFIEIYDKKRI